MSRIYAIGDELGNVKIGMTDGNVRARMQALQTGNYSPLTILAEADDDTPRDTERHFHDCLRSIRTSSRGEWFAPTINTTVVTAMMQNDLAMAAQYAMDVWAYNQMCPMHKAGVATMYRDADRYDHMRAYRARKG